jgi:hypothetical protein
MSRFRFPSHAPKVARVASNRKHPQRFWIKCIVCGRSKLVPASDIRPPRSPNRVHLCGRKACMAVWKSAIANQFNLHTYANFAGEPVA